MASFLSRTNTRADNYGGALENRLRLPLEAFEAVRASVGQDFVVGCRFLAEECIGPATGSRKRPPWASPSRPQGWISFRLRAAENSRTRRARPSMRTHTTDGKRRLVAPDLASRVM